MSTLLSKLLSNIEIQQMFEHNKLLGIFSIDFYLYKPEKYNKEINISLSKFINSWFGSDNWHIRKFNDQLPASPFFLDVYPWLQFLNEEGFEGLEMWFAPRRERQDLEILHTTYYSTIPHSSWVSPLLPAVSNVPWRELECVEQSVQHRHRYTVHIVYCRLPRFAVLYQLLVSEMAVLSWVYVELKWLYREHCICGDSLHNFLNSCPYTARKQKIWAFQGLLVRQY